MITLLTRFDMKDEGSAGTLAAMLAALSGTVPAEPGHIAYDVFGTEKDALAFYVKESWASREDADAHAGRLEASGRPDCGPARRAARDRKAAHASPRPRTARELDP